MRYLILIIAFGILLYAQEAQTESNFSNALKEAKSQNKNVMMIYSAKWCPECNYMKDVVFKNKELSAYMKKHFTVLALDIQKDKLPEGFNYIGIPTFFIVDKNGKEKNKIEGGDKAEKFLRKLKALK